MFQAKENNSDERLSIFPNPSDGEFSVKSQGQDIQIVEVVDVFGRIVNATITKLSNTDAQINIPDLPKGLYFVKIIRADEQVQVVKIINQ